MTETARVDEFAAALENKGYGSDSLDNETFARLVLTTINGTSTGDVGHLVADHGAYEALRLLLDADDDELDAANLRPTAEAQRAGLREVGLVTKPRSTGVVGFGAGVVTRKCLPDQGK